MKKRKIYLILAIITSLLLFTTGALCNQCSKAEDPLTVEEEPPEEESPKEEEESNKEVSKHKKTDEKPSEKN